MDDATIKKLQNSLQNMRVKVVAAKGESVEGLTPVSQGKSKTKSGPVKDREGKE